MSKLSDLLIPKRVHSNSSKLATVVQSTKYINSVQKIGKVAPLQNPGLQVEVKKNVEVPLCSKDDTLLITALLTKYPKYKFRCKVKSGECNVVKYWFTDTSRLVYNIHPTVIMRYKDMLQELESALSSSLRLQEQGFDEVEFVPKINSQDYAK
jgi:hypothetical protein